MISGARFVHTNLIARDWRRLADFYIRLFGCVLVPPERNYSGPELEAGTAVPGSSLAGAHYRLPGYGDGGPTLEIFTYSKLDGRSPPTPNRLGFGHLAFQVDSVGDARAQVLDAGGSSIGDVVVLTTTTGGRVTWCYVTDPEGNILELQSWESSRRAG